MPCPIVTSSKFVGIAGLGLLSSSALTLSFATLPALLTLPTPSDALPAFYKLKQQAAAAQLFLTATTGAALATALALSPRSSRHPYLLWMGLATLSSLAVPRLVSARELSLLADDDYEQVEVDLAEQGRGRSGIELRINGEVVREAVAGWRKVLAWQSLAWGLGWAMGTVGVWGEGA